MSARPPTVTVIDGHMTHTRTRRERGDPYEITVDTGIFSEHLVKITKYRVGRIFVEVLVWAGTEATGDPVAEWEMPHVYRYDHDAAARQAVAQTTFPAAEPNVDYPTLEAQVIEREGPS